MAIQSKIRVIMSPSKQQTCLKFSLICTFMLIWLHSFSQYNFGELDKLLQTDKKLLGNNFAVLISKDGKPVYQKQNPDFTVKTQAPIYDAGQWLTAALVLSFVDEGKLSLDDKVSKFIPIFKTYMKGYITIRDCITHSTGIRAETGVMKVLQKSKYASLEDEVVAFASKREIEDNPGTAFFYSNVGFDIAGRVLEIVSKKSFDRLIQDRILRPMKMRATNFTNDNGGAISPSSGAKTTANDFMNFLGMLLNKGTFEGKKILSEKSIALMESARQPALPVKNLPKMAEGWSYGMGDWIMAVDSDNQGTVLSAPSETGSFAFIDRCRNYAGIIILQNNESDIKKQFYTELKTICDGQVGGNGCQ